jgi:uncharacterized protein (DUF885 family)
MTIQHLRFRRLLSIAIFAFITSLLKMSANPTDELNQLFKDYWTTEMEHDPFSATSSGIEDYNDRVPDVSPQPQKTILERRKKFRAQLDRVDFSAVSTADRISAEILGYILDQAIELHSFEVWRIPFVSDSGFHNTFGYVLSATPFKDEKDYRNYLKRLEALPGYYQQNVANMRAGLKAGFTQPRAILDNVLPSFEALAGDVVEKHPFYAPFVALPNSMDKAVATSLRNAGKSVLKNEVIPAHQALVRFMREEYLPGARQTLGASDQPNGKNYYAALVRYYTTLKDATPEFIHQKGLEEVSRIRAEMDAIIADLKFMGSFTDFLSFLRTDPQFYPKTGDELLKQAAWIAKKTDGKLPAFFTKLPRQPYSVEPVPKELEANYTGGRYSPAPPGSNRGGQYWVNTYALETRPLYQLTALSLHEGVPGHHLQISLAYEIEDAPEFRAQYYPHAFGEGWGLYSEKLGVEMGMYETPYDHFGRLSYEMWRACRLVVDTGIHAFGWSRQRAVDYLAANTALSLHEIGTEVDRYIAWPGQALAYKMGELTLWELRSNAENALGSKFDIRIFHDTVLEQGGLPLAVLRSVVEDYILSHR